jgi:hypothetical protein
MIIKTFLRARLAIVAVAVVLAGAACTKKPPAETILPSDRVAPSPVGTTQTVLQETFAVKKSVTFPFEVPAHAVRPHLHGIFASYLREVHGISDDSANVDLLIINEEQYADLNSNRPSEALMSVEASHNQAVNFDLPASLNQPVKYYLVFRNSSGGGSKIVDATFRVDF